MSKNQKLQKRRAKIRKLVPGLDEESVLFAAVCQNPIERIGYLILKAHEASLPVDQLYLYRNELQLSSPGAIEEAQNRLRAVSELKACESNYRQITILRFGLHGITHDLSDEQEHLDDKAHRPAYVDPVLRGPARAQGYTAQAIKRRSTYTDWQMQTGDNHE